MTWIGMGLLVGLLGLDSSKDQSALSDDALGRVQAMADRGVAYMKGVQNEDGTFGEGDYAPAMTGLALVGLLRGGNVPAKDPAVQRALAALEKFAHEDGGIYADGSKNRNYGTAIAILALAAANADGRYQATIDKAVEYMKHEQWDEEEGIDATSPKYGGAGYGSKSRPDLSNTAYFLEALQSAGVPKDDPAYERALTFISRCQNLSGEGNELPQAALVEDGGFYYTPAEDYNPGGKNERGGLRSYASMTYAGLKSFIHAGLTPDDPRVKAAMNWIKNHYTLEENPGMGQMGLYYYYHTFAKALDVLDIEEFEAADGQKHDWRMDLVESLVERQRPDGSWANDEKRWMESDPRLVTAYALMALGHVR